MNKADLVTAVKDALGDDISKSQAEIAVNAVIDGIKAGIQDEGNVQLIGFGTFKVTERKGRTGINPKTREPMEIPPGKSVKFIPGKALKDLVD